MGKDELKKRVYKGSADYLPDEETAVESPAAADLAARAMNYTPEKPLYVLAIGAITNVASAILKIRYYRPDRDLYGWVAMHCTGRKTKSLICIRTLPRQGSFLSAEPHWCSFPALALYRRLRRQDRSWMPI